jgi:hypothetical protein
MPGIGLVIDGAMQQAPQSGRHGGADGKLGTADGKLGMGETD